MIVYRVGDVLPVLTIKVMDGGAVVDLTALDVYVRWQRSDGTVIAERTALPQAPTTSGLANYVWQTGDLNIVGLYTAIVQLAPTGQSNQRYSLTNPPLIEIEVLANTFATLSNPYPDFPTISGNDVAIVLQRQITDLDGNRLVASIERGKSLAYVYGEFFRCNGTNPLTEQASAVVKSLISNLAAREYTANPSVIFGPYKKETIGSYGYEMRDAVNTKNSPNSITGIPELDAMIEYLRYFNHLCGPEPVDILFPDWTQPVTTTIPDPTIPLGNRTITE